MLMRSVSDMSMIEMLKADAGHRDSLNHCAPIYRRVTQCDISARQDVAPDAFIEDLHSFQRLIDFLGQVSQILCTDGLNNELFLIAQAEGLSKISICQSRLGFLQQRLGFPSRRRAVLPTRATWPR